MIRILRWFFFGVIVRIVTLFVLGMNIRNREKIPLQGPAIIVANHNSHLDTMVLMSLIPLRYIDRVQPVAAADYFLKNRLLAWFSQNIIGIIPVKRKVENNQDPLQPCYEALNRNQILIFFPEGSRGEPEKLAGFKSGLSHIIEKHPEVPVIPMFLHGLGKALPKGEAMLVPFFCDVFVGDRITWTGERRQFMHKLDDSMHKLAEQGHFIPWE